MGGIQINVAFWEFCNCSDGCLEGHFRTRKLTALSSEYAFLLSVSLPLLLGFYGSPYLLVNMYIYFQTSSLFRFKFVCDYYQLSSPFPFSKIASLPAVPLLCPRGLGQIWLFRRLPSLAGLLLQPSAPNKDLWPPLGDPGHKADFGAGHVEQGMWARDVCTPTRKQGQTVPRETIKILGQSLKPRFSWKPWGTQFPRPQWCRWRGSYPTQNWLLPGGLSGQCHLAIDCSSNVSN